MTQTGIDVVVPCYNYGRFLEGCIESALSQQGCRVRVLVIDDASTDGSLAEAHRLAAADPRVEVRSHASNKGHIATYNEGIAWARAKYMTLLSSDDLLAPLALARAVEIMEARPEVGFVYGQLAQFADDTELRESMAVARAQGIEASVAVERGHQFIRSLCEHPSNLIPASGVVVRTTLQQSVGGYLAALPHSGDLEMWLRLAAHADLARLGTAQCFTRVHTSNMRYRYSADHGEEDYRQRERAFALFFEAEGESLQGGAALARLARRNLSWQVLSAASRTFDGGDQMATARLSRLARSIDSSILQTPSWWKLALKRKLGPDISRVLSPLLQTVGS